MDIRIHISLEVSDIESAVGIYSRLFQHEPTKVRSDYANFRHKLSDWLSKAEGSGLSPRIEENVTCCYATANKFWAQDPDGHEWEFWVRSGEADSMHGVEPEPREKVQCCAPGKC